MNNREVRIGLIQMSMTDNPAANLEAARDRVAEAAGKGAQIVVLPELFLQPYFCQRKDDRSAFDHAEPVPGPATDALGALAKEHGIVLVGGSIFEKADDGTFFNTCPVFGPKGDLLAAYRKSHIPEDILYHEQHYFAPGDTGIIVVDTPYGKIAPLICFDQWFPEAARLAALQGAEILVYPTAIGVIDDDVEENITGDWETMWRSAMLGHAAANSVYVAAANRVGKEGSITFWGGSFVADPSAAVLAKGGSNEEIVYATCELGRVKALQDAWGFLRNRRRDLYRGLAGN